MAYEEVGFTPLESNKPTTIKSKPKVSDKTLSDIGFVPLEGPATKSPPTQEESVQSQPEKNRGFVTSQEVDKIASSRGVDAAELKALVPFYNIDLDDNTEYGKRVIGLLNEGVTSGALTFLNKKLESKPEMRAALDDLREVVDRQKTLGQMAVETGLGLAATGGIVKGATLAGKGLGTAAKLATGATAGALGAGLQGAQAGLAHSREGEEVKDSVIGAGLGLGLAGAAVGATVLVPAAYKSIAKYMAKEGGDVLKPQLVQRAEEKIAQTANHLTAEKNIIMNDIDSFSDINAFKRNEDATVLMDAVQLPETKAATKELENRMTAEGIEFVEDEAQKRAYLAMRAGQEEIRAMGGYVKSGNESVKLGFEEAAQTIKQLTKREGGEAIAGKVRDYQEIRAAKEAMHELADAGMANMKDIRSDFFSYLGNKLLDASAYVAPKIDRQLGTKVSVVLDNLAEKNNRLSMVVAETNEALSKIKKTAAASKMPIDTNKIYEHLDGQIGNPLNKAEAEVKLQLERMFASGRAKAREMGLPIPKRESYVPHTLADFPTVMSRMSSKADDISKTVGRDIQEGITLPEFLNAKNNPVFQEYLDGLGVLTGSRITNAKTFNAAQAMMKDTSEIGARYGTVASASLAREGFIPNFLREKDVFHLASRWHANTFRHIMLRREVDELKKAARIAVARGDKQSAEYLGNLIIDLSGGNRDNTLAKTMNVMKANVATKFLKLANDESKPKYIRNASALIAESPEILNNMKNTLYSNVLGWSPKAVFTNVFQPVSMGLPELGVGYGAKLTTKGYAKALQNSGQMTETLQKLGKQGASWQNAQRQLEHSLTASSPELAASPGLLSKFSDLGMVVYEKSEVLSKLVVHHMAEELSSDLIRYLQGDTSKIARKMGKEAEHFISTMPPGYRREVTKHIKAGDEKAIRKAIGDYMQSKIVFNYSRASMSEFGRSMGPLFSTFLKWPTSIAGDAVRNMEEGGVVGGTAHNLMKYAAPYMALDMMNNLISEDGEGKLSQRQEAIMGKDGLTRLSPAGNLKSIVSGDFLSPPVIGTAKTLAKGIAAYSEGVEEGNQEMARAFYKAGQAYGPGYGFLRFIGEDAPAILTGEKAVDLKEEFLGEGK